MGPEQGLVSISSDFTGAQGGLSRECSVDLAGPWQGCCPWVRDGTNLNSYCYSLLHVSSAPGILHIPRARLILTVADELGPAVCSIPRRVTGGASCPRSSAQWQGWSWGLCLPADSARNSPHLLFLVARMVLCDVQGLCGHICYCGFPSQPWLTIVLKRGQSFLFWNAA